MKREKERGHRKARRGPTGAALERLWSLFPLDGLGPPPRVREVGPEELPESARDLLVHARHMTVALQRRHGSPVDLHVLSRVRRGDLYARRLFLTVGGGRRAVLFGIMRINLAAAPPAAREEVLRERMPLGAILIRHRVLRRIEPLQFIEVDPTPPLGRLFGLHRRAPLYGRLATIHCGGAPAVDLLEVIAP